MRSLLRSFGPVALGLAFATSSLVGCASPAPEDDVGASEGAQSTTDPRTSLAAETQSAVLWQSGKQTAAIQPKKLEAIFAAFSGGEAKTAAGRPRCMPTSSVTFFGAEAKQLGVLSSYDACGGSAYLTLGSTTYLVPTVQADLSAAFEGPQSIGEILHGADELLKDGEGSKEPAAVAAWVKAYDPLALPKLDAEPEHDEKMLTLTYRKDGKELASVDVYMPKDDKETKGPALVSQGGKKLGWVELDIMRALGGGVF